MMNKNFLQSVLLFFLIILSPAVCFAQNSETFSFNLNELPEIEKLNYQTKKYRELGQKDPYETYSKTVEKNYKLIAAGKDPEITFYRYFNNEFKTVLQLAARCNITYETLVTLNRLDSVSDDIRGKTLILPTCPGLFLIIDNKINNLETLINQNHQTENLTNINLCYSIDKSTFVFLPNKKLTPTERAYFLDSNLGLPLEKETFWISSDFGMRENPFSGEMKNHNGIDLAASEGTPVYAVKDGCVSGVILNDSEFGNYIVITHDQGKMTSIYAHLSKTCVERYDNVRKGTLIGYVGMTGKATGPHLHFEIKMGGVAKNPKDLLNL